MLLYKSVLSGLLFVCVAGNAIAQSVEEGVVVPLAVDQGVPLRVQLTAKVPYKKDAPVHGKLIAPIYAFDRVVIPSGARIEGSVTGFRNAGKWSRISAMLSGNFTPLREPDIEFTEIILPDGSRRPLETIAVPGTETFVEAGAGKAGPANREGNSFTSTAHKSGKERLKGWLWGMSPVRPQYLPAGLPVNAMLTAPMDFGEAVYDKDDFDQVGSDLPEGSNVPVRLMTTLSSGTAVIGTPVESVTTRPIFASNGHLILPVGSRLRGHVTAVDRARSLHHNGKLSFTFTSIEPPDFWTASEWAPHPIDGNLSGVQVGRAMKGLRLGNDGSARIVESKKRFIAPAWAFFRAQGSLNNTADPFGQALFGAYRSKFIKEVGGGATGSGFSFGLPASISGAMIPPVGIGFGFFGAARSIYATFLKKGRDIYLPVNTVMEVRLETKE